MTRLNIVLAVSFKVLLGIAIAQAVLGRGTEALPPGPFLEGLSTAAIEQLVIDGGEDQVTLTRSGDEWIVKEAGAYPADGEKVDQALHDLVALSARELVSSSDRHHVDLEIADEDFNRRVRITTRDGVRALYVGKSGRGGTAHVRRGGEDEVYAARDFSPYKLNARAASWLDRVVFEADKERIAELSVRNPEGSFHLQRDTQDSWRLAGEVGEPDGKEIDKLLAKVATVRLQDVAGKAGEVELGEAVAEVEVLVANTSLPLSLPMTGEDGAPLPYPMAPEPPQGERHVLRIAPKPGEDNTYLLRVDDQPYVVEVGQWAVKPLLETSASDLVGDDD